MKITEILDNSKSGIKFSIITNMMMKPISMVIGLLYTPLLLNYLGKEKYGVWVTILSIVNWITTFDVGLGNGLRNTLTAELLQEEYEEARKSISTAYIGLTSVVTLIFVCGICVGQFLNWNSILNTDIYIVPVLLISFTFICINFILAIQNNCYYAIQKSEVVALIGVLVQVVNLTGVYCLSKISTENSLVYMAILTGMSGFIMYVCFTIRLWKRAKYFVPSVKQFCKKKLKKICSLGVKFFLIQIAALILFTTDSLLIANIYSPSEVTPYNTVYKVFGIVHSVFAAILVPMWSRFTVAKEQNDYEWMKNMIKKMQFVWLLFSFGLIILVPIYQPLSDLWLGQRLDYTSGLVFMMAIYYIAFMYSGMYSTVLNGLGDINVQLVCAIVSAISNIPLSIFFAKTCGMGLTGICLGTIIGMLFGNVIFTIQVKNILKKGLEK